MKKNSFILVIFIISLIVTLKYVQIFKITIKKQVWGYNYRASNALVWMVATGYKLLLVRLIFSIFTNYYSPNIVLCCIVIFRPTLISQHKELNLYNVLSDYEIVLINNAPSWVERTSRVQSFSILQLVD